MPRNKVTDGMRAWRKESPTRKFRRNDSCTKRQEFERNRLKAGLKAAVKARAKLGMPPLPLKVRRRYGRVTAK